MWTAFPSSDYYEDSVTIGVSPRRPSRVPLTMRYGSARLHAMISVESLFTIVWLQFLEALVTGLVLVVVIALAFRFLKVRSITIERESESRDQDPSN